MFLALSPPSPPSLSVERVLANVPTALLENKGTAGPSDAWFCPICNSENRVSRGFERKCRVCKATPAVQIRHDEASESYRQGVRVHLRGLCSHLYSSMVNHASVLEQYVWCR